MNRQPMTPMPAKVCADCAHAQYRPGAFADNAAGYRCHHPSAPRGVVDLRAAPCSEARSEERACGLAGRWHQRKPSPDLPIFVVTKPTIRQRLINACRYACSSGLAWCGLFAGAYVAWSYFTSGGA